MPKFKYRFWNAREKGLGGRVFGETANLLGLVSAALALALEKSDSAGGADSSQHLSAMWLAVIAGVFVALAGISILVYARRHMKDAAGARRCAYARGLLWLLGAGGGAAVAGICGLSDAGQTPLMVFGAVSLLGWATGEGFNVVQQKLANRSEHDVVLQVRNAFDAIFSIIKVVGILGMAVGMFLSLDAKLLVVILFAIIAIIGVVLNLLMGALKLYFRGRNPGPVRAA